MLNVESRTTTVNNLLNPIQLLTIFRNLGIQITQIWEKIISVTSFKHQLSFQKQKKGLNMTATKNPKPKEFQKTKENQKETNNKPKIY